MKTTGSLLLIWVLTACTASAGLCPEGSGPETVTVDASTYGDLGPLRICVSSQFDDVPNCVEFGLALTTSFEGEYPKTLEYQIYGGLMNLKEPVH